MLKSYNDADIEKLNKRAVWSWKEFYVQHEISKSI